jgi:uncharacterized protein YcsI (UPF0317 family)
LGPRIGAARARSAPAHAGYTAARARLRAGQCLHSSAHLPGTFTLLSRNRSRAPAGAVGCRQSNSDARRRSIRTDIPRYHVFRDGEFVEEVADITSRWRDDLVTFALGCSFRSRRLRSRHTAEISRSQRCRRDT